MKGSLSLQNTLQLCQKKTIGCFHTEVFLKLFCGKKKKVPEKLRKKASLINDMYVFTLECSASAAV